MKKPTQKEISDCIAYFADKGIYAYLNKSTGGVIVSFDMEDIAVEISNNEVLERAELYNLEMEQR